MSASKVLLVSNAGWNLYNYRLPLANALVRHGIDIALVCPNDAYAGMLRDLGFRVIEWPFDRRSLNVVKEATATARLASIYKNEEPNLVHHITIKPNLYGPVAARMANVPLVVNTWTGLGFVFGESRTARLLRTATAPLLRWVARSRNVVSIYQTQNDLDIMVQSGFAHEDRSAVIPGSGVDVETFHPAPVDPSARPVVLMASRLLWDKGVREFVQAARAVKDRGLPIDFQLAGAADSGNLNSLRSSEIQRLRNERSITFLGHRSDMPVLLRAASIAVLPTYYNEGIPRFLLEAAATGIPIVTTRTPGCTEVVKDKVNGLLVPPRNHEALAASIEVLAHDPALRTRMGQEGRRIALERFDADRIVDSYLDVYRRHGLNLAR